MAEWKPGRWWRVLGPDEALWCETSSEQEAREAMRPGDRLERLYERGEAQWREVLEDGRAACELCGSGLVNGADGWPAANDKGCIDSYHDGGYGSQMSPGYCGVFKRKWYR